VWQSNTTGNSRYEQVYPITATDIRCAISKTSAAGTSASHKLRGAKDGVGDQRSG